MNNLTLHQLHEIVGGRLRLATLGPRDGEWTRVARIGTDSRQLQPGEVFWAMQGRTHDGAAFTESAFARGASGVIAAKYVQPWPGCWALQVDDGREALYRLVRFHRDKFCGQLVAVGGTTSASITRRLIAALLESKHTGTSHAGCGSRLESVALGLLSLETSHEFSVLEFNLGLPGDLSGLAAECGPSIAAIAEAPSIQVTETCANGLLHDPATQLLNQLCVDGHAVLNGDDAAVRQAAEHCKAGITWVGETLQCDLVATRVGGTSNRLSFVADRQPFQVAVSRGDLSSVLCAIGVGRRFGMSMAEIAKALEVFDAPPRKYDAVSNPDMKVRKPVTLKLFGSSSARTRTPASAGDILAMRPLTNTQNHILRFDAAHRGLRRAA